MAKPKNDKNIEIPDKILRELLTPCEWRMLKNRWYIINLLEEGLSIRKIAEKAKVGTDTVVRVAKISGKIRLKKPEIKKETAWIFGKGKS